MTDASSESKLLRKEDRRLLTGRARFTDDVHLDGMLQGVFIRSPFAHAEIVSIDATAALAAGASLVLTAADLPFLDRAIIVRYWHESIRGGLPKPLASDRVRYVGEPVAFLVARDRYEAEDLAALVNVEYRPLQAVATPDDAQKPDAPSLHDGWTGNVAAAFSHRRGDVAQALSDSPRRLKRSFRFGRQVPLPLETRGCVMDFDTDRRALTAWMSTQAHYNVRQNLATMLDVPEYAVKVIAEDVGGGFGGKSRTYMEELIVGQASKALGRPVKWIEDRFEHMQATTHSRAMEIEIEVGYREDGSLIAIQESITVDIGGYIFTSGIVTAEVAGGQIGASYKVPFLGFDVKCVGTNKTPVATYRGAGQPEANFPLECMLDLIAKDLGMSGAELRLRNFIRPSDLPYVVGTPKAWVRVTFENGDFPAAFTQALANSGYNEKVERLDTGEEVAWGLACMIEGSGFVNHESCHLLVDTVGRVTLRSGMTSQGQGHVTVFSQLCAERLGVHDDDITVQLGDTALIPFGRGAFATRGVVVGANAVAGAADRLRETILRHAGTLLQKAAGDLSIVDGRIVETPGATPTSLTIADIAKAVAPGGPLWTGEAALEALYIHDIKGKQTIGFGVQIIKVALDKRTGRFRVLDCYFLHDCGRILHPVIVEGQVVGGMVDGVGGAMLSEVLYSADGQLLTGTLAEYLVITAPEAPRVRTDHFTTVPDTNPLGVRGVGEGGVIGTAPAIVNALSRMIAPQRIGGEEALFSIPLRPENVLRAIDAVASV